MPFLNQRLIDQRLKRWGCKTYITDNAQYGLHILTNHKVDLVLMDLKMPGMNGFEITKLIRSFEKPGATRIPIVALSADFSARDKKECKESGIDDFILKPYSSEELLQKLFENKKDTNSRLFLASRSINSNTIENGQLKINLSGILEECMGELELLQGLMVLYKQNALEFIGKVRIHLQNSESEQIGFAVHKIIPGLKMMQSKGLIDIVEQIQKCSYSDPDVHQIQFLYESFLEEYTMEEIAIDSAMDELRKSKG